MSPLTLTVTRTIAATPAAIYARYLDPDAPGGPWFGVDRAIVQPVVDGLFFHAVNHADRTWAHYGRFVVLEPGQRIVHTWVSEATGGAETALTLTLVATTGGTTVTLVHAGVPDDELGRRHREGWAYLLDALALALEPPGDA